MVSPCSSPDSDPSWISHVVNSHPRVLPVMHLKVLNSYFNGVDDYRSRVDFTYSYFPPHVPVSPDKTDQSRKLM